MRRFVRWAARAMAAGVICLVAAALAAAAPTESKSWPEPRNAPNVYGGSTVFVFSGLDGKTAVGGAVTAVPIADGIGLKFHLPKAPILRIRLKNDVAPQWQVVSNDLVMAKVPNDDWSLVILFATPNTVCGYLPAGTRVSVEGGDANFIFLRKEIGDRIRFSVAYDATPAGAAEKAPPPSLKDAITAAKYKKDLPKTQTPTSPAVKAAAAGMEMAIDVAIDHRLEFLSNLRAPPTDVKPLEARAMAKAFSVMKSCVLTPEDPVKGRWLVSDRWPDNGMSLRDTAFGALGVMHMNMPLAKEILSNFLAAQTETGLIPARLGPGVTPDASAAPGPPILAYVAWQMYNADRLPDAAFLEQWFDAAQKNAIWFMKNRRVGGEPPPTEPLEFGTPLYFWKSPEESGMESSPRFDGGAGFPAIDLSCYLANEAYTLQAMAQKLGYRELAKAWGVRADAIAAAARREFWDADSGFFFDRKAPDGQRSTTYTSAGLLPLWAGIATQEQADRLREHVVSKKFWTAAPLPTVARDDPGYKTESWRGPAWPIADYLVIRGLQRYGYAKESGDLRARLLALVAKWYGQTSGLYEFYDADDQAAPADLTRKAPAGAAAGAAKTAGGGDGGVAAPAGAVPDFMPTAAVYVDLVLRPK